MKITLEDQNFVKTISKTAHNSLIHAGDVYYTANAQSMSSMPDELVVTLGNKKFEFERKILKYGDSTREYTLRYGTNPSQIAALYVPHSKPALYNWDFLKMGKQGPSATNIEDINQGLEIIKFFEPDERPAAIVMKHLIPSGFAVGNKGESQKEIYMNARDLDYLSSFGGVVVLNQPLELETAKEIAKSFIEVIAAPNIEDSALEVFLNDPIKENVRIVKIGDLSKIPRYAGDDISDAFCNKAMLDGTMLVESPFLSQIKTIKDLIFGGYIENNGIVYKAQRVPDSIEVMQDMLDSWHVLEGTRSNAAVIMKDGHAVCGAGETKRVDAVKRAAEKAKEYAEGTYLDHKTNFSWKGAVGNSDGFPPFDDTIHVYHSVGVEHILIPPGGRNGWSIIDAANKLNMSITFTPFNARCFTHR